MRPLQQLLRDWPLKLAALLLAVALWFIVSLNDTSVTQRSLLVPLTVEGVTSEQVVVGLPDVIEVTVSGPSTRIDRLRPENIEALLDLAEVSGEFRAPVQVRTPNDIVLERVRPSEVIGFVELVTQKRVPVEVVLFGETDPDLLLEPTSDPAEVLVRGRSALVGRVVFAFAPVPADTDSVTASVFAGDASGAPVAGVTIIPAEVAVTLQREPVLRQRTAPLVLIRPSLPDRTLEVELDRDSVTVAAPSSVLADIATVPARVEFATEAPEPGRYTLPVMLELPPGAVALETVSATVVVSAPPLSR